MLGMEGLSNKAKRELMDMDCGVIGRVGGGRGHGINGDRKNKIN